MNAGQIGLVRDVFAKSGIELVGVGCPQTHLGGKAAADLGCERLDDLRTTLTSVDADVLLIADPGAFGDSATGDDLEALRAAHARNLAVATLEPIPASAGEVPGTDWIEAIHAGMLNAMVKFVPRSRRAAAFVELDAALETFGVIRSCSISMICNASEGTLGARLFDGMDLVRAMMGAPETIEASYVSPSSGRGVHSLAGLSLRDLHGDCTVNLRFSDGRACSMLLSDQAGNGSSTMIAMGEGGHIVVNDLGFCWRDGAGGLVDSYSNETREHGDLAGQLIELCSGVGAKHAPIEYASVLSMTHAALLSSRTGQGESPEGIRRLLFEG